MINISLNLMVKVEEENLNLQLTYLDNKLYVNFNNLKLVFNQNDLNTIELQLKQALYKMLALDIKIYPSGRTDRYVHAINQVFHFDLEKNIPTMGILRGLNSYLPKDIRIKSVELVDESFHSRFSAKSKEYRYYVYQGSDNPFIMRYALVLRNLNIDKMQEAIKLFEGKHDFKGFASASIDPRKDTNKTIFHTEINLKGDFIEFIFIGSGFLKYQIRRMMGLLIEIGLGRETKDKIVEVLQKKDPSISHKVCDGYGLYLYNVNY